VLPSHVQTRQEPVDGEPLGQLHRFAVDHDVHGKNKTAPRRVRWKTACLARRVPFAGIIQIRFEGSRAAPGSQETSPRAARVSLYLSLELAGEVLGPGHGHLADIAPAEIGGG